MIAISISMIKKENKITIIVPLLNEEDNVSVFYERTIHAIRNVSQYEFSFLFVDDGSKDRSWNEIEKLSKQFNNVSGVKLSRNFGSHTALLAGIVSALSKKSMWGLVLTTIDLQNPPELIVEMIKKFKDDVRVVWGVRSNREDGGISGVLSNIYHKLVKIMALSNMPNGGVDYCLLDRQVAHDIVKAEDKNTSLFGLILWLGYHQEFVPYVRKKIAGRSSRWSFVRKMRLAIDTFMSFSYTPIWLVTYIGFGVSLIGFTYGLIIAIRRILYGTKLEGWSSLMVVTLLLFGILFIMLGIIVEYIWRTYDTSRKRPIYLVDKKINI